MPVPGSRDQFRDHTVRNPDGEDMRFFEYVPYHGVADAGRSPGTMERALRGCVLAVGQIRLLWKQDINYTQQQDPYSWTDNRPQPGDPEFNPSRGFQLTRALRYMTRSIYVWGGSDNTRLNDLHTVIVKDNRGKPVSINAGQKRTQPTIRNRMTSFGARVPVLNTRDTAGEENR